jgi:hypothetical protein
MLNLLDLLDDVFTLLSYAFTACELLSFSLPVGKTFDIHGLGWGKACGRGKNQKADAHNPEKAPVNDQIGVMYT